MPTFVEISGRVRIVGWVYIQTWKIYLWYHVIPIWRKNQGLIFVSDGQDTVALVSNVNKCISNWELRTIMLTCKICPTQRSWSYAAFGTCRHRCEARQLIGSQLRSINRWSLKEVQSNANYIYQDPTTAQAEAFSSSETTRRKEKPFEVTNSYSQIWQRRRVNNTHILQAKAFKTRSHNFRKSSVHK